MFLLYADFGPDGAVIQSADNRRQVGQYVVFSAADTDWRGIPLRALYQARTLAQHDLDTNTLSWYKNRHKQVDNEPLNKSERDVLLIQLLASEAW